MARCETIDEVLAQIRQRKINYLPMPLWYSKPGLLLNYIHSAKEEDKSETFLIVDTEQAIQYDWEPVFSSDPDIECFFYKDEDSPKQLEGIAPRVIFMSKKILEHMNTNPIKGQTSLVIGEMSDFSHHQVGCFNPLAELRSYFDRVLALSSYHPFVDIQWIWAQFMILDMGTRLGKDRVAFYDRFFYKTDDSGKKVDTPEEKEDAKDTIMALTSDIIIDCPFDHQSAEIPYTEAYLYHRMGKWEASMYNVMHVVLKKMTKEKDKKIKRILSQLADGLVFDDTNGKNDMHPIHEGKILLFKRIVQSYSGSGGNRITVFCASEEEVNFLKEKLKEINPIRPSPLYRGWIASSENMNNILFLTPDSDEDEIRRIKPQDMILWFSQSPKIWQKRALIEKIQPTPDYERAHMGVSIHLVTLGTIDMLLIRQTDQKSEE